MGSLKERHGIDRLAVQSDLIMQMTSGAAASAADDADRAALRHLLTLAHQRFLEMGEARRDAHAVVDHDRDAVLAIPPGMHHATGLGGVHRQVALAAEIDAL